MAQLGVSTVVKVWYHEKVSVIIHTRLQYTIILERSIKTWHHQFISKVSLHRSLHTPKFHPNSLCTLAVAYNASDFGVLTVARGLVW